MDPWANPDSQNELTQQAMITRLEDRGRHPIFLQFIRNYASTIAADSSLKLLEIGCGTGVVLRQIAETLHPASELHGADISEALLSEAKKRDLTRHVRWQQVPSGTLSNPDGYFDVVVMHTLLSHVPNPESILLEAKRVLKPGGRIIIFDADHASTTYSVPDYEQSRRINHLLSSAISTHPDICRQMPRLLKKVGFKIKSHRADVISECGTGDYWLSSVRGFQKMLPALQVLSAEEGDAWVSQMLQSHENGTFFASGNFYTFDAIAL